MTEAADAFARLASAVADRLVAARTAAPAMRSASTMVIDRLANVVARRLVALTDGGDESGDGNLPGPDADAAADPDGGLDAVVRRVLGSAASSGPEALPLEPIAI